MFEKVQSLPENNGNSCLMTAACHALGSCPFVCPWSCSHRLEPDPERCRAPGLARTAAPCHGHRHGLAGARGLGQGLTEPLSPAQPPRMCGAGCRFREEWGLCGGFLLRGNSCFKLSAVGAVSPCSASHRAPGVGVSRLPQHGSARFSTPPGQDLPWSPRTDSLCASSPQTPRTGSPLFPLQ